MAFFVRVFTVEGFDRFSEDIQPTINIMHDQFAGISEFEISDFRIHKIKIFKRGISSLLKFAINQHCRMQIKFSPA
jgi:hypothetical protein